MNFDIQPELDLGQQLNCYAILTQLNPGLKEDQFHKMILEMQNHPYKMLGVLHNQEIIAISGYWILTKLYCGKYLEMDNVVVDDKYRSLGIGKLMVDTLSQIAIQQRCNVMMLDAYIPNIKAHTFYESLGFEKKGYHFVKPLF